MKIKEMYFSGLSRNVFLLSAVSLFADISTESLYPVLPIFLTSVMGAPASVVGLVEGVAQAAQNIIQGFTGWFSDRIQNRKAVALFGYGLAAISKPLIGLSSVWPQVLGGRTLDRLGSGARSAPRDGLIASSVALENRGKAFGLEGIGDNMGAVIGPLLAIFIIYTLKLDLRSVFYLAFIPGALAFLVMVFVEEIKTLPEKRVVQAVRLSSLPVNYWKYLLGIGVISLGNSSNAFLILRAKQIGVPLELTIFIYALFNLVAALASYPSGSLADKYGGKIILLGAMVIFILTYLGFAMSTSIPLVIFLFILYGVFSGAFRAVGKAIASEFLPNESKAFGIGIFSTVIGIFGLLASIFFGQIWDRVNPPSAFWFSVILAVIGSLLLLFLLPKKNLEAR